jgi:Diadenosine tetraphosphate (Ap4A) hydrolase and other HIT family hydrolases
MASSPDHNCGFCSRVNQVDSRTGDLVWEFPQSVVVLGTWQYFEGYCIAICRNHVRELFELDRGVRHAFIDEIALLGQALANVFGPRKLNVEMLGNQVPHLHCHLFPRSVLDPDHLKPAWVAIDRAETDSLERTRLEAAGVDRSGLRERIRAELLRVAQ